MPLPPTALHPAWCRAFADEVSDYGGSDDEYAGSGDMSSGASGYNSGNDTDGDDMEDKELMVECGQRLGRWKRYEEELEAREKAALEAQSERGGAVMLPPGGASTSAGARGTAQQKPSPWSVRGLGGVALRSTVCGIYH